MESDSRSFTTTLFKLVYIRYQTLNCAKTKFGIELQFIEILRAYLLVASPKCNVTVSFICEIACYGIRGSCVKDETMISTENVDVFYV